MSVSRVFLIEISVAAMGWRELVRVLVIWVVSGLGWFYGDGISGVGRAEYVMHRRF